MDILHLPNTNKDPISKSSFRTCNPIRASEGQYMWRKKIDICNKAKALTLQNRRAGVVLGVGPDVFVVIFAQHIIVPVLTI